MVNHFTSYFSRILKKKTMKESQQFFSRCAIYFLHTNTLIIRL
jgi:hypothetical protein